MNGLRDLALEDMNGYSVLQTRIRPQDVPGDTAQSASVIARVGNARGRQAYAAYKISAFLIQTCIHFYATSIHIPENSLKC